MTALLIQKKNFAQTLQVIIASKRILKSASELLETRKKLRREAEKELEAIGQMARVAKLLEKQRVIRRRGRRALGVDIIGERPIRADRPSREDRLKEMEERRQNLLAQLPDFEQEIFSQEIFGVVEDRFLLLQQRALDLGITMQQMGQVSSLAFEGMAGTLQAAGGAIIGGFIDMAIAGKISGKALAKAALEAASGALKGLAIQATSEALFNVALGFGAIAKTGNPAAGVPFFTAAKLFGKVAGAAAIGSIALGRAAAAIDVPSREQVDVGFGPGGVVTGRGARGLGVSDVPQQRRERGGLQVNINVSGFVGDESALSSKIGEIIREGVFDDIDFGLNVSTR